MSVGPEDPRNKKIQVTIQGTGCPVTELASCLLSNTQWRAYCKQVHASGCRHSGEQNIEPEFKNLMSSDKITLTMCWFLD